MHLGDLGERRIIDRIWERIGRAENYDDCVYLERGDKYLLLTTDFIGEGTHFMREWDMKMVGRFFASINLSDIAAMGGIPEIFMASMFFPRDFSVDKLEEFVDGMVQLLQDFNVSYRGGDFKESRVAGMSGIAVGSVEKDRILRRKGAQIDDGIYITGPLGRQAAGYYLWKRGVADGYRYLLDVYPRIEEGRKLGGRATSCMDISDGLSSTVQQMQRINGLGFRIDFDSIPVHPLALEVSEDYGIPLESLVLEFGGEYELLFTSPGHILGREIGVVVKEDGGIYRDGRLVGGEGYEHFSALLDKIRGQ